MGTAGKRHHPQSLPLLLQSTNPPKMYPDTTVAFLVFSAILSLVAAQAPFLYNAPYQKRWEFEQVLAQSQGQPRQEVDRRVLQWIATQPYYVQMEWSNFQNRLRRAQNEYQYRMSRFSPEAAKADSQLNQIANNPMFSPEEKGYLVHQIIDHLPPNVKQEIISVLLAARPQVGVQY